MTLTCAGCGQEVPEPDRNTPIGAWGTDGHGHIIHIPSYAIGKERGQLLGDISEALRTTRHEGTEKFYVTFGSQYTERNELHPQGMNANGYFVIEAPDEMVARAVAVAIFKQKWSMIYSRTEFWSDGKEMVNRWYPLGELGRYKLLGTDLRGKEDDGEEHQR